MDARELIARKGQVSSKVLLVPGVSGIGIGEGHVVIYLEADGSAVREEARALVERESPGTPLAFQVTGPFKKG